MKILVTGGSGLIGTAIRHHLVPNTIINYDLYFDYDDYIGCSARVDARIPLHKYMYPDLDVFIDCARYGKPSEQFITWNTVINHFKQQGKGKMILFSSIYGHKVPDFSIYQDTEIEETPIEYAIWKAGTEHATRFLAQKLKPYYIQVNCIAPGGVHDKQSLAFQQLYKESGGVSMITTKNILPVIDMLLHKDNAINGQVITIDKGWSL
jgi:NAD(P)-dependent dehydrogenase (short-subunit alcohol dehydrogenase family)